MCVRYGAYTEKIGVENKAKKIYLPTSVSICEKNPFSKVHPGKEKVTLVLIML